MADVKKGYVQSADHVQRRISSRLETLRAKPKPVTKEWLADQYTTQGRNCVQIGAALSRDPKTIWAWMKHYGIPTRPRGHDVSHLPVGRPPGFKLTEEHKESLRAARLKDGRKPYMMPDGSHAMKGRIGPAHHGWKGGLTPERQSFYSSEEWKSACKAVWARAGAKCERCGTHHNTTQHRGTFHVHHRITFMVRELRADLSNLALLCAPCHRFVHSRKNTDKQFIGDIPNGNRSAVCD